MKRLFQKTDDELMSRVSKGDTLAFQALFDRHSPLGLSYSRRMLGSQAKAEDILQEAWINVVKLAESYKAQGTFKAWFLKMLRNKCLNQLRSEKRLVFTDEPIDVAMEEADFEVYEKQQSQLKDHIDQLPEAQRTCLCLRIFENKSYEEVASTMGTSKSSVKSLIHRAKQTLVGKLGATNE